jgi:uridine kinase
VLRQCAGLFFLAAAARVAPEQRYHLGAAIGPGCVVHCDADAAAHLSQLQTAMAKLAIERAPFVRELWTTDAARTWLASRGHEDAVAALRAMRSSTVVMAGIDGVFFPAWGPVMQNAEDLSSVRLVAHPDGMLLDLSDLLGPYVFGPSRDAAYAAEKDAPRFGAEMTRAHVRWLGSMSVTSAGAFNDQCVSGKVRDVVRVAEGFHEKRLGRIADAIAARAGQVRVICIAGPSSSGKTTFIKRLTVQLEVNGVHPVNIGLDDYYVDRERTPRDSQGDFDFEAVEAIDVSLFQSQLRRILAGERVRTARFDFKTGRQTPEGGHDVKLGPADVLLVEGIHGLNPGLMEHVVASDQAYRVFVHPAATLRFDAAALLAPADVRLLRRIVRDRHGRGYSAAETIARWPSVRRGEETHIYTQLQHADVVFDTSLVYEMSVLKVYADRYLLEVGQDHSSFPTAYRLRHLLDRFVTITPDHVPPTSILREFIGGSGFEY